VTSCLVYAAARGRSPVGKLLYVMGGIGLATLPAAMALSFMSIAWYGGKPDPAASVDGRFYVRAKHRLTEVSEDEYRCLQRLLANENWYRGPGLVGLACIALARLMKARRDTSKSPPPAGR
jgi:hypothetical protein